MRPYILLTPGPLTTTGILNPLKDVAHAVKMYGKRLIVDAMSSFGGVPLDVWDLGTDFLISSTNKCIQGVPGFVIYPGKISQADTFRIGNIGDVHPDDFRRLIEAVRGCRY